MENNFDSSGTLTQQIEQGSPVDLFLSAAAKPMDDIEQQGLLEPGTRENLLRNRLVLIASSDSQISNFAELTSPKVRVVALAILPASQLGNMVSSRLQLYTYSTK